MTGYFQFWKEVGVQLIQTLTDLPHRCWNMNDHGANCVSGRQLDACG